jgi:hypothetical protein
MRSFSAERNAFFVRILITATPRTYREVLARSILFLRPEFEVLLAPPVALDGRAERFGSHVLVQVLGEHGFLLGLPDGANSVHQPCDNRSK